MYLLNNLKFDAIISRTVGDTQYPRGWFLNAENRAAIGVIEVPDPEWPDPALFSATENLDGTLTVVHIDPEVLAARTADIEARRVASLWQAAHEYEFAQISGSAIGLLAMGVMTGKPKCIAVQGWIKGIWTTYYERKAGTSTDNDFTVAGECPHTVPELMDELGV